jgi:hypothetical protein
MKAKIIKNQIKYFDVLIVYSDDVLFGRNITGGLSTRSIAVNNRFSTLVADNKG